MNPDNGTEPVAEPVAEPRASRGDRFRGFFERVDGRLVPFFGGPEVGPYDEVPGAPSGHRCPICGHDMTEHVIDRGPANHLLYCPDHTAHPPLEDTRPLNDLGMPRGEGSKAKRHE